MTQSPRKGTFLLLLVGLVGLLGQLYFQCVEFSLHSAKNAKHRSAAFSQRKERRLHSENTLTEALEEEDAEEENRYSCGLLASLTDITGAQEMSVSGRFSSPLRQECSQSRLNYLHTVVLIL